MPSTTKIDKIIAQIEATTHNDEIKELARELSIEVARQLQQYRILIEQTRRDNTVAITDSYISLDDQLIALRKEMQTLKELHILNRTAIDEIVARMDEIANAISAIASMYNGGSTDNAGSETT